AWSVDRFDWRPPVVTLAFVALAVAALVLVLLRDHPADIGAKPYGATEFVPKPAPAPGAARRTIAVLVSALRTGPFWLLAGMFVICGASTNGIMWSNWAPAAHDHGMAVTAAASMLSLIGIFSALGAIFSGWLTDRFDPRRLLTVYFAIRALTLLALPLVFSSTVTVLMIAFVVVYGLVDVATVPPVIELSRRVYGEDGPIVFGWANSAHQLGAGAAAFLGATARDMFGTYDVVWTALSVACVVAALMALVVRAPRPA
ncbi:MFS transporter, partial [Streptomyces anulatus]